MRFVSYHELFHSVLSYYYNREEFLVPDHVVHSHKELIKAHLCKHEVLG